MFTMAIACNNYDQYSSLQFFISKHNSLLNYLRFIVILCVLKKMCMKRNQIKTIYYYYYYLWLSVRRKKKTATVLLYLMFMQMISRYLEKSYLK